MPVVATKSVAGVVVNPDPNQCDVIDLRSWLGGFMQLTSGTGGTYSVYAQVVEGGEFVPMAKEEDELVTTRITANRARVIDDPIQCAGLVKLVGPAGELAILYKIG